MFFFSSSASRCQIVNIFVIRHHQTTAFHSFLKRSLKADTFFIIVGNQLKKFSSLQKRLWKKSSWMSAISTRVGEIEWRWRKTKYFAFISHICLLSFSKHRQRTSNSRMNNCIKKHRVYAYLSFAWNNHDWTEPRLMIIDLLKKQIINDHERSRFSVFFTQQNSLYIFILPLVPLNEVSIKYKDVFISKTQFYLTFKRTRQEREENHARLFSEKFPVNWQLKSNCWCLHNLTNSCRLILFVQLCWKDKEKNKKTFKTIWCLHWLFC